MKAADLVDQRDAEVRFCNLPFLKFGRMKAFHGPIATAKCFEDNVILKAMREEPGEGRVKIADVGESTRCAVFGDILASLVHDSG